MEKTYKLELQGITKLFPGVRALHKVDLKVRKGTIHAVMGENGAGKSTLMKIINGLHKPDAGRILINGEEVSIKNPQDARAHGIAMIFQELNYFPDLSVQENIFMGQFPGKVPGLVDWKEISQRMQVICEQENLEYNPNMKIKELSVSDIQMLEIIKSLSFQADIIIMDEPTSAISDKEVENLFQKIFELKERGFSILYISHKMDEIFRIADDLTIMRDGEVVATGSVDDFTEDSLISYMVGRKLENVYPQRTAPIGETILELKDLYQPGIFRNINMNVRKGEIVGIAGLVGAGRTELARAIFGMDSYQSGEIIVDGKKCNIKNIQDAVASGIVMLSEDRARYGIIPIRSIRENISLSHLKFSDGFVVDKKEEAAETKTMAKNLNVRAVSLEHPVYSLSGGNQQKVVLAKWLLVDSKIMILDEPTRGIDVGAKFEIYRIMMNLVKDGISIIMISSEMPELIGMADRIYVMNKGHMVAELERTEFSQETIMKYCV